MVFMDDLHDRRDLHVGRRRLRLREHRLVTSQEFEGPNLVTETDLDDATAVLGLVHHVDASNERPLFRCEGGHRFEQAVRIEGPRRLAKTSDNGVSSLMKGTFFGVASTLPSRPAFLRAFTPHGTHLSEID
jgi:hypothetical protein